LFCCDCDCDLGAGACTLTSSLSRGTQIALARRGKGARLHNSSLITSLHTVQDHSLRRSCIVAVVSQLAVCHVKETSPWPRQHFFHVAPTPVDTDTLRSLLSEAFPVQACRLCFSHHLDSQDALRTSSSPPSTPLSLSTATILLVSNWQRRPEPWQTWKGSNGTTDK
jgi:hypothetical protein